MRIAKSTHAFWSPKAKAEVELLNARLRALEEDERRLGNVEPDAVSRPVDLDRPCRRPMEVTVHDRELWPDYGPLGREGHSDQTGFRDDEQARHAMVDAIPVGQPGGLDGLDLASGLGRGAPHDLGPGVDSGPVEASSSRPRASSDHQGSLGTGVRIEGPEHRQGDGKPRKPPLLDQLHQDD